MSGSDPDSKLETTQEGVTLPKEIQGELGRKLRQVYGELLSEPLPDKFSKLLSDLASTEKS